MKAKELLKQNGVEYQTIELDHLVNAQDVAYNLFLHTQQRTVPNIFINGQHVGGYDKLLNLYASGNLQKLVQVDNK